MMGSFLTRGLVMVFGYAYPAYECFKTVEKNKPEIEQLRFWCQYWILVAMLTVFERIGDAFISWLPMYSEAKLAFYIYLWYPKTKGTTYIYDSFFRPYVSKHETEIDRNLMELKTRAGDIAVLYWQRAASYGQTRVFEILQYVASQSTSRPQPSAQGAGGRQPPSTTQTRQQAAVSTTQQPSQPLPSRNTTGLTQRGSGTRQAASAAQNGQEAAAAAQPQESQQPPSRSNSTGSTKQPPSRTNSAGSNQQPPYRSISTGANQQQQAPSRSSSTGTTTQRQQASEQGEPPAAPAGPQKQTPLAAEPTNQLAKSEVETMNVDPASSSATEGQTSVTEESVMEGTIRMTRGKLRTRAATNR